MKKIRQRICSVVPGGVNMEDFYGKRYELVKSEHFDDLLIFLEIGFLQRQLAMTLKPVQYITRNEDGTYSLHFKCTMVKSHFEFVPGEEFDETKPDGITVRSLITMEGNKLSHRQVETNGRTLHHVYEFFPHKMTITTTGPGFDHVVKRHYVPVK